MPATDLEEFDYLGRALYPHLALPGTTLPERVAIAKHIRSQPREDVLLLAPTALASPTVIAGLTPEHIEAIMRLGALSQKVRLLTIFDSTENITEVEAIAQALGRETGEGSDEVRHRLARVRLYANDHRSTFIPSHP